MGSLTRPTATKGARPAAATKKAKRGLPPSHLVGIGGSAGSLEPLEQFFRALRPKSTMSFIVVTHRDPRSEGMMIEILARYTTMAVREAVDGQLLEPNVVYVNPSSRYVDLQNGRIKLLDRPTSARVQTSIDSLFQAIAKECAAANLANVKSGARNRNRNPNPLGVAVVLSGMGRDGTVGLSAIKESSGIALIQDPSSAAYDAMPRSAIVAGLADFVGTPTSLAESLNALASHGTMKAATAGVLPLPPSSLAATASPKSDSLDLVLTAVRTRTGHDFSQYKKSTLQRRVERRMTLRHKSNVSHYLDLLAKDPKEVQHLLSDLLINVTRFFRDADVFDTLKNDVIPRLLHGRASDRPLRVWVAGCATGEEAYSIAILLREHCDQSASSPAINVQIYATDLDEDALRRARNGLYSGDIASEMSPERLDRYFVREEPIGAFRVGGRSRDGINPPPPALPAAIPISASATSAAKAQYRIKKNIRDMVVFAKQSLVSDPPFTRLDLLCCRNVLIYLEPSLQRKLLSLFLYALSPGGFLVLGASEGIQGFEDGFKPLPRHGAVAAAPAKKMIAGKKRRDSSTFDDVKIFQRTTTTHGLDRSVEFPVSAPRYYELGTARIEQQQQRHHHEHVIPTLAMLNGVGATTTTPLLPDTVQRAVIEHFAPPVVVVDQHGDVIHASQSMDRYLTLPVGKTTTNVFAMAREGLAVPLRTAFRKAIATGTQVTERHVRTRNALAEKRTAATTRKLSPAAAVDVSVVPLSRNDRGQIHALIAFVDVVAAATTARSGGGGKKHRRRKADDNEERLEEIRLERDRTKAELVALMGEMRHSEDAFKTVNEELQSTNEELQSTNEELQSTNEELTTSKEEMQSMNEELLTLNAELQTINEQLATTNDDMRNLLNSSQIPTLFLDNELRLKRYTAQATRIARLIASDVGRPITDISWSLRYDDLARDVKRVIDTLISIEMEVVTTDNAFYMMRIHPYRTIDDLIDGVVITFTDITQQKREALTARLEECERLLKRAIARWPGVAWVEDVPTSRSIIVSNATERLLGYPKAILEHATEDFWRTIRSKEKTTSKKTKTKTKKATTTTTEIVHLRSGHGLTISFKERTWALAQDGVGATTLMLHLLTPVASP